ncbi:class D sortase [Clostridium sp. MB40-C1]|uniref:class D sortase n=1 Tax=Clostridium sp. MB40-C1 TaxID=3070996 RepID=UPI0027E1337A|nr:class D sortase [Clostridium sp. MB40-C1]WMJ79960.1 class D sortase [Clostridium sp. MB40-C1]
MSKNKVGIAFIFIGVLIITTALFLRIKGNIREQSLIQEFNQQLKEIDSKISDNKSVNKNRNNTNLDSIIGILSIPKIDCKVPVCEGIDKDTLKYSVGHFKDTPLPGSKGNCCIAGHRSYTYNEFFNRLDELKEGDEIYIQNKKGKYKYIVYKKQVVEPTEVSVLNNTKDGEITLVTCTPIRVASHRLIIKGKLISC